METLNIIHRFPDSSKTMGLQLILSLVLSAGNDAYRPTSTCTVVYTIDLR